MHTHPSAEGERVALVITKGLRTCTNRLKGADFRQNQQPGLLRLTYNASQQCEWVLRFWSSLKRRKILPFPWRSWDPDSQPRRWDYCLNQG